jgi:hypothetical protein
MPSPMDRDLGPEPKEYRGWGAFDRVLVAPSRAEVKEAAEAAAQPGPPWGYRPDVPWYRGMLELPSWADALARLEDEPEGQHAWGPNTPEVGLAWWRDFMGRLHVRVHRPPGGIRQPLWLCGAPRSALAAVYPDQTLTHVTADGDRVLVLCACGAWGEPAALGWMGDCCGPCHDRRAAGGATPRAWPLSAPHSALAVAAAEGGWALAVFSPSGLSVWDLKAGTQTTIYTNETPLQSGACYLGVSSDGRYCGEGRNVRAITGCRSHPPGVGLQVVYEVVPDRENSIVPAFATRGVREDYSRLTPNGDIYAIRDRSHLAVYRPDEADRPSLRFGDDRAQRILPMGEPAAPDINSIFFGVSADGGHIALFVRGVREVRRIDARTGQSLGRHALPGEPDSFPAFAPDGRPFLVLLPSEERPSATFFDVLSGRGQPLPWWPQRPPRPPWQPWHRGQERPFRTDGLAELTFSPSGQAVAGKLSDECWVWAVPDGEGGTAFEGHFEAKQTSCVSFLPDGRLLRFDWRSGAVNLWPAELFR